MLPSSSSSSSYGFLRLCFIAISTISSYPEYLDYQVEKSRCNRDCCGYYVNFLLISHSTDFKLSQTQQQIPKECSTSTPTQIQILRHQTSPVTSIWFIIIKNSNFFTFGGGIAAFFMTQISKFGI